MSVAFRAWDFLFELVWIGIAVRWDRRTRRSAPVDDDVTT
jgi:hypothetical protein